MKLRKVSWVAEQLDVSERSAREFLRRYEVPVIRGRIREDHFYEVWDQVRSEAKGLSAGEIADEVLGVD